MGWFDNEEGADTGSASTAGGSPHQTMKAAAPPSSGSKSGSTMGPQVRIDGTIVCGEDLTILGKVEGTIRAKGTLVIAERADVRAAIDGQRVLVHGKVEGDVHGDEKVVLGPTAHLIGNIDVSTLEILEGAYFKGSVEMKAGKKAENTGPTGQGSKQTGQPEAKSAKPTGQADAKGAPSVQGKVAPDTKDAAAGAGAQEPGVKEGSKNEGKKPGGGPGSS